VCARLHYTCYQHAEPKHLNINPNLNVTPNPKLGVPKLGYMYPYASRGSFFFLQGDI